MKKAKNKELLGAVFTICGGACWGLSGSMGQYLFTYEGMNSNWLVPIRLGGAGILLLLYSLFKYKDVTFAPWKNRKDRISLLIYGLAGISACQYFYFLTIQLSNAGIGTILQDLSPVMILLVMCIIDRRLPKINEILSIFLALLGVFLITTHGDLSSTAISPYALLTGVIAAVAVTVYNIQPRKLLIKYPIPMLQGWAFLLGSIMFSLLFQPWTYNYVPSAMGIFGIFFVIVVGNILAFTLYMTGVSYIGPEKSILYGFSEPITAALITVLFMDTPFTKYDAVGFLCVFLMLVFISYQPKEKKEA